jgi:signal transduction histidine kinase
LLNLILNAAESMQPHGGVLTLTCLAANDENQVGIAIHDTGRGIDAESVLHLFEPFFTTKETGLGLGLAISYDIVQKHGGRIQVDGQPGLGTTFTVWLPLVNLADKIIL